MHIHTYIHTYTQIAVEDLAAPDEKPPDWDCRYIHTHTHTYAHTRIHTYIHTYTQIAVKDLAAPDEKPPDWDSRWEGRTVALAIVQVCVYAGVYMDMCCCVYLCMCMCMYIYIYIYNISRIVDGKAGRLL